MKILFVKCPNHPLVSISCLSHLHNIAPSSSSQGRTWIFTAPVRHIPIRGSCFPRDRFTCHFSQILACEWKYKWIFTKIMPISHVLWTARPWSSMTMNHYEKPWGVNVFLKTHEDYFNLCAFPRFYRTMRPLGTFPIFNRS